MFALLDVFFPNVDEMFLYERCLINCINDPIQECLDQHIENPLLCPQQAPLWGQTRLLRALPSQALKTPKDGHCPNTLGSVPLPDCPEGEICSSILSNLNLFYFNLCPLALVLLPCVTVKNGDLSSQWPSCKYWGAAVRCPKAVCASHWTTQFPLPLHTGQRLQAQPSWWPSAEITPVYWCLSHIWYPELLDANKCWVKYILIFV